MASKRGLIIYFDGPDGAGKTTQLKLVAKALKQAGREVFETRTMGGTPIGEKLREAMLADTDRPAETDLHIAVATQYALAGEARKRRDKGQIVLIDRSPLSIIGYQVYGDKLDAKLGEATVQDLIDLFVPDLIIVYKARDEVLAARRYKRNHKTGVDYFENKPVNYHKKVAKGFAEASRKFGATVINADQPIKDVHELTMAQILLLLQT